MIDEINRWIKERRERINRKRMLYAILPGIILFIVLFTYAFIQYHTFYAEFSIPQYKVQAEEIIITRGFNPFNERISTGYFQKEKTSDWLYGTRDFGDIKDYGAVRELKNKIKISSWDKNNWESLAEILCKDKSGELLYKIGRTKLGIEALIQAFKEKNTSIRNQAAASLRSLGKADNTVIAALLQALKDEDSDVRLQAAASLGMLWQKKSDPELIELLKHPLSEYRTAAAYALKHKKSLSPGTLDEINKLKDEDPRPWVRLGAWKAFELLQEKKEKEENKDIDE